jgi:hypothetical protein
VNALDNLKRLTKVVTGHGEDSLRELASVCLIRGSDHCMLGVETAGVHCTLFLSVGLRMNYRRAGPSHISATNCGASFAQLRANENRSRVHDASATTGPGRLVSPKLSSNGRSQATRLAVSNRHRQRMERDDLSSTHHPALSFCLSMISAQTLRVCREGNSVSTFPDHALVRPYRFLRRMGDVDDDRPLASPAPPAPSSCVTYPSLVDPASSAHPPVATESMPSTYPERSRQSMGS